MSNKVKDIDIRNQTNYFFKDIINIKNFDPNIFKIDEKLYKNVFNYYIRYVTIKDSKYVKINNVKPLYLIFNKFNGYFEEINGNNYLMLFPTNEITEKIKKCEEVWSKIRSITKSSEDYDEKCIKVKFNSDDKLHLNKTVETPSMTIVVRTIFYENKTNIIKFS